jgi:uracil-DNA glycosylase
MSTFPFGAILNKVEQKDQSPKKVFILGVYASAVHAKWIGADNKVKVKALAVASEPYIFWRGDNADKIIEGIKIPKEVGHLEPADSTFNGPSGLVLDSKFLLPVGLTRDDVWLSDIIPYTRINPGQRAALERDYDPLIKRYNLPECTIPDFKKQELDDEARQSEILSELEQSCAKVIVLLGDLPIRHFLSHYTGDKRRTLADYGKTNSEYGKLHTYLINNKEYEVLPLVHPRQAGKLGRSDSTWFDLHEEWISSTNNLGLITTR